LITHPFDNKILKNIIFDLDGTLIDSGQAILDCMECALVEHQIQLLDKLGLDFIGPPLDVALEKVLGEQYLRTGSMVVQSFKRIYDSEGFKISVPYSGIGQLLASLRDSGLKLYIATNKRIEPTLQIVSHLGWQKYFSAIYGINTQRLSGKPFIDKSEMIACLLTDHKLVIEDSIYIGDRLEDQIAAERNNLNSVIATWGYGDYTNLTVYKKIVREPIDLNLLFCKHV
jgi:phosphoglycolate phosphatase